jgi:aminoglycoside phosphotransferase family enzyme
MDLDFKDRRDLSKFFVERYVKYSGDRELEKLLDFYKCYRAYVRGKVNSFRLNDPSVDKEEKSAAKKEAKAYFELATDYARRL